MTTNVQSRKDKISLLKGILNGTRSLKELLPHTRYFVFSDESGHDVIDLSNNKKRLLGNDEFEQWKHNNYRKVTIHLVEGEPDKRDEPILDL